jgi:hypothetical protein
MLNISTKSIIDDKGHHLVQVDEKTFHKMEEIIEDYGLVKLMQDNLEEDNDELSLEDAKKFYAKLPKID